MIYIFLLSFLVFFIFSLQSQSIGINTTTPHSSAALDVESVDNGILIPRMKRNIRMAIQNPVEGLLVYEIDDQSFWYYSETGWEEIGKANVFVNDGGLVRNNGDHATDDFLFGSEILPTKFPISDSIFFFDKSKAAFRAGRLASSDRWAPEKIGFGSVAMGYNNEASGDYSTALGLESQALGTYSFTAGTVNKAVGVASMQ